MRLDCYPDHNILCGNKCCLLGNYRDGDAVESPEDRDSHRQLVTVPVKKHLTPAP